MKIIRIALGLSFCFGVMQLAAMEGCSSDSNAQCKKFDFDYELTVDSPFQDVLKGKDLCNILFFAQDREFFWKYAHRLSVKNDEKNVILTGLDSDGLPGVNTGELSKASLASLAKIYDSFEKRIHKPILVMSKEVLSKKLTSGSDYIGSKLLILNRGQFVKRYGIEKKFNEAAQGSILELVCGRLKRLRCGFILHEFIYTKKEDGWVSVTTTFTPSLLLNIGPGEMGTQRFKLSKSQPLVATAQRTGRFILNSEDGSGGSEGWECFIMQNEIAFDTGGNSCVTVEGEPYVEVIYKPKNILAFVSLGVASAVGLYGLYRKYFRGN